jgi:hypothetical protein
MPYRYLTPDGQSYGVFNIQQDLPGYTEIELTNEEFDSLVQQEAPKPAPAWDKFFSTSAFKKIWVGASTSLDVLKGLLLVIVALTTDKNPASLQFGWTTVKTALAANNVTFTDSDITQIKTVLQEHGLDPTQFEL